jgi:cellulose synthase/poly-beta-1,6-N-acetylglucosamine synthase-like glycosyltransferase
MTLIENEKPIYFLRTNPYGWKRVSLAKLKETASQVLSEKSLDREKIITMSWSERDEYLSAFVLQRQERCWEQETGVKPEDTHFTLIVPIHNEENSLSSFLGTFMLSDIPSAVNMQVVFVTNACNDASIDILLNFLSGLGSIEKRDVIGDFADPNIHPSCDIVEKGHMTFIHVDTSTAGKANALGIGNVLADRSGHIITMSLDANNFVEPDAIRTLFTYAHRAFRREPEPNDTVLFGSVGVGVAKTSRVRRLINKFAFVDQHLVDGEAGRINGWMMAWNTLWMVSIGGPPGVALEDYALGVLARVQKFKFHEPEGVNVWGYVVNDFKGLLDTRARHVRGKKQICDYFNYDPYVMNIIESESFYMKRFTFRVKYLLDRLKKNPLNLPRYTATFLIWEYAIWKGMKEYKRNPKNQSWEKVASTY